MGPSRKRSCNRSARDCQQTGPEWKLLGWTDPGMTMHSREVICMQIEPIYYRVYSSPDF